MEQLDRIPDDPDFLLDRWCNVEPAVAHPNESTIRALKHRHVGQQPIASDPVFGVEYRFHEYRRPDAALHEEIHGSGRGEGHSPLRSSLSVVGVD